MEKRCPWAGSDPLYTQYHDLEWGVPVHDERRLFEFLVLEGAQAGLSWAIILRKRDHYREVFDNFDVDVIATYDADRIESILGDPGIVRNRAKVLGAVENARAVLRVRAESGSLDQYLWSFVGGRPIQNRWTGLQEVPSRSSASESMSRDLKARGFRFVGPTICYAFMQAVGMVNDHIVDCFRHQQCLELDS